MSLKDTLKTDAAKAEAAVEAEATGFLAKSFTGKILVITAAVAFVAGLLVHLL